MNAVNGPGTPGDTRRPEAALLASVEPCEPEISSEPAVLCLECRGTFKALPRHLRGAHNMSTDTYLHKHPAASLGLTGALGGRPRKAAAPALEMSTGRQGARPTQSVPFEEDAPRQAPPDWDATIDAAVSALEPHLLHALDEDGEAAVDRVMAVYDLVVMAVRIDPAGFDLRARNAGVKPPKAGTQIPEFFRATEYAVMTTAKRLGKAIAKREAKDTIRKYAQVCHWLLTQDPPLLGESARQQIRTVKVKGIVRLWKSANPSLRPPSKKPPVIVLDRDEWARLHDALMLIPTEHQAEFADVMKQVAGAVASFGGPV